MSSDTPAAVVVGHGGVVHQRQVQQPVVAQEPGARLPAVSPWLMAVASSALMPFVAVVSAFRMISSSVSALLRTSDVRCISADQRRQRVVLVQREAERRLGHELVAR